MKLLFLQLSNLDGEARAWLRQEDGLSDLGRGLPAQFAQQHPGSACVVFLPSSHCLFARAQVSAKQLRQAEQSLAWLIEEQAAEDVESLHVVAGPSEGESTPLVAVSRQLLATLLTRLRADGLHTQAVVPDLFLLPRDASDWQLRMHDGQALLRTGVLDGAALEADLLPMLLDAAWQERGRAAPLSISLASGDPETATRVEEWAAQHDDVSCMLSEALEAATALQREADWSRHPANLLQGAFASRARLSLPPSLRHAAVFLIAAFALQLVSEWVHYGYYRYQAGKTAEQAVSRYRAQYPDERLAAKPAAAWQDVQKRLRGKRNEGGAGASDVLPTLTRVAQSLQGSGLGTQRIDVLGGVLTLDVDARTLGELDGFKQQLESAGFITEIVSANNQGGVIRGRLRVEGGA